MEAQRLGLELSIVAASDPGVSCPNIRESVSQLNRLKQRYTTIDLTVPRICNFELNTSKPFVTGTAMKLYFILLYRISRVHYVIGASRQRKGWQTMQEVTNRFILSAFKTYLTSFYHFILT